MSFKRVKGIMTEVVFAIFDKDIGKGKEID